MRRLLVVVPLLLALLVGCAAAPPAAAPPDPVGAEAVTGDWTGPIEIPGSPLDVGIRILHEGDGLRGEIDIPVQGIAAMPLGDVRLDGCELAFTLPEVPGDARFRGVVAADGTAIEGEFTQNGQTFPLVLRPGTATAPERPQEPQPPFPYRAEEVTYRSGEIDLAGTLTLPEGDGPFTAVLLITGSGAQNRDEELFGHKPFLLLADALTRAGHAMLRVDDRGVGGSGGTLATSTYDDLVGDVVAGVEFLRGRPEIDPERIGLLGHSEGGYLAPLVAGRTDVAFVVTMAGPAVSGEDVLVAQNRLLMEAAGTPAAQVEDQVAYVRELIGLLRAEDYAAARALVEEQIAEQTAGLPADQQPSPEQVQAQVESMVSPYMRSFLTHDPTESLRALDVPVLAFFGGKDLQVPASQSEPVLRELLAGHPDPTIRAFPGLNHLMQPAITGAIEEYATIPTTIDQQVLDLVTGWVGERFPA
ncbi:alpha/beta hydrolase family protein [Pseudonocardia nigra]|uniref:alpha/beta hydrolase family protein n=1 Tax=Pseudonocardia nigra TaxID=1921578 RepID=UPI001C603227|nr:alpha/beta fold hydrolase [Pseudonocardia nigra]